MKTNLNSSGWKSPTGIDVCKISISYKSYIYNIQDKSEFDSTKFHERIKVPDFQLIQKVSHFKIKSDIQFRSLLTHLDFHPGRKFLFELVKPNWLDVSIIKRKVHNNNSQLERGTSRNQLIIRFISAIDSEIYIYPS